MQRPKFKVPAARERMAGRVVFFLASVAAVSYLLVRFGTDYASIYYVGESFAPARLAPVAFVLAAAGFAGQYYWVVAAAAVAVTLLLCAVAKSGAAFTVLGVLVWLAGAAAYFIMYLPARACTNVPGG